MSAPFIAHTDAEIAEMLAFLGLEELDDLFAEIPEALRLAGGLDLPPAMSEPDVAWRLEDLAARNRPCGRDLVCFAGAGSYDHEIPAVVSSLASRSEFLTAYTPYQPEVSQGVLQAVFEFQTMIARLCGLDVANASLYDGAAALVEAVNLAVVATGHRRVLCSQGVNPHWRRQLETFSRGPGHEIDTVALSGGVTSWDEVVDDGPFGAVVVAAPNFLGCLEDIGAARAVADRVGARLVVCFDPVSAGLLRPPGELGADVVVGEGQPFGTALGFGGPYLGLFACRLADVRRLPGRIVGETVDREDRHAYVMTLRAREQDIRRARASSNVCTNQTLMAVTAAIHLSWLGPKGLREVALRSARATRYTREALCRIDAVEPLTTAPVLREFAIKTPLAPEKLIERLVEEGFLAGVPVRAGFEGTAYEGGLLVAATERRTRSEIDDFAAAFEKAVR
ncbi:MAG: aminomethyl-transferring glycine dehydrogenase subunit GcvPA [Acidimicrobiales bacterium]